MKLYNLKDHNEQVSFAQAIKQGLGKNQGLFFPLELPEFELTEIDSLLKQDFVTRSANILSAYLADEFAPEVIYNRVKAAFAFPAPVAQVEPDIAALELFHGPTLAFKDFGGRFMAQMLQEVAGNEPVTILTATSGDTGAAVAHAFYGLENVRVVILYPQGKSARCRKNCSARWVETSRRLLSMAILMIVRPWLNKPLMMKSLKTRWG